MDLHDSLPVAACLALHAGGVAVAFLNRAPLKLAAALLLRVLLVAFVVTITGLALEFAAAGLTLWTVSAMTLALMIVAIILHGHDDEHDPVLTRFVASNR